MIWADWPCIILVNLPYLYICILIYEHINSGPRMPSMSILFDRRLSLCRWILSLFLCHIVLGKRNHSSYFICALSFRFAFFFIIIMSFMSSSCSIPFRLLSQWLDSSQEIEIIIQHSECKQKAWKMSDLNAIGSSNFWQRYGTTLACSA